MIDIISQIETLISQQVPPGKIAIIYKENRYGEELLPYFKLKNLPVYSKRSINLLEDPLIGKILLIIRYLASEHEIPFSGDEMLFEILHAEWFRIPAIEIASITAEVAQKQYSNEKISLRKLLSDKANKPGKDLFSQPLNPALAAASGILENLISAVSNTTLQSLFEAIFRESGLLRFAMQHPEKQRILQILTAFFDFIKEETRRQPLLTLQQLVTHLDLMEDNSIDLPLIEVNGSADSVNLLTVHGSKGWNLNTFFLRVAIHTTGKRRVAPIKDFISRIHYCNPTQVIMKNCAGYFTLRSPVLKHIYIFPTAVFGIMAKKRNRLYLLQKSAPDLTCLLKRRRLADKRSATFNSYFCRVSSHRRWNGSKWNFINRVLENFQMNVTALNNYLKCPLEFYFKNLIRIPSPKNENTEFGSSVHFALEQLFRKMMDSDKKFPESGFFIASFDWYMDRHRESFTHEQFRRRKEYGHIILPAYYEKYVRSWNPIVSIERRINNVSIEGVPAKGMLDKLEFDGKQVNIVDYKTGNPDNSIQKIKGPNDKQPLGGDYWRQAVFYKLLVDRGQRDWQVVSTEFDFIEPNNKGIYIKQKLFIPSGRRIGGYPSDHGNMGKDSASRILYGLR